VAVDAHAAVLDLHERLELLAAGVLLDVSLQGLHRPVDVRPGLRRDDRDGAARVRDVGRRGDAHQNFCPHTRCPTISTTAKPAMISVSSRKKSVAGPASSVVYPPKLSMG